MGILHALYTCFSFSLQYIIHSSSLKNNEEREIALIVHKLEKGLSSENFRTGFGKAKVLRLLKLVENRTNKVGQQDYYLQIARAVLYEYVKKNKEAGFDVENYCPIENRECNDVSGSMVIEKRVNVKDFNELVLNRHSIRVFDCKQVEHVVLKKMVEMAKTAPSACNRQAVKVYAVLNKDKIEELANLQNGDKDSKNAPCWLVITVNLSFYAGSELKMVLVDAGIFTNNLILSAEYLNLTSCVLHGCMRRKREKRVKEICGIPVNEMISNFVIIGYPKDRTNVPKSYRKENDMLLKIVEER